MSFRVPGLHLENWGFTQVPDVSAAAGAGAKVGQAWTTARKNAPDWDGLTKLNDTARTELEATAIGIDAQIGADERIAQATLDAYGKQTDAAVNNQGEAGRNSLVRGGIGAAVTLGAALMSDETTKDNIEPIDNALATLRQLRPVSFQYNEEYSSSPERLHHGFTAQEYSKVLPDATYFDESTGKLCIDTGDLIGLLVRAVQQLESRLTHAEAVQALSRS